jgi:hypothetical protein
MLYNLSSELKEGPSSDTQQFTQRNSPFSRWLLAYHAKYGNGATQRTIFTLDWIEDPVLRRHTGQELNKGESRNSLSRAVFIHRLTAIILWNTRYLESAIGTLRQIEDVPGSLIAHLSPLGWEHINLTGDYIWGAAQPVTENTDGLMPLRPVPEVIAKAA